MDVDQLSIKELSASPYGFRKSLYRRKSLSEFDPKLGNDIQHLLKSADTITGPDNSDRTTLELPILDKLINDTAQKSNEQRKLNIDEAIDWVKNELKSLKDQDKSLMRQFLDLRASINELKEEIDPFDDLGDNFPRRSMSMLDHLNIEKRNSRFALGRRLIEDIEDLEDIGQSDSEVEEDGSTIEPESPTTESNPATEDVDSSFIRGRPLTHSVSIAAKAARPSSAVVRGRPKTSSVSKAAHSAAGRPVSDSSWVEKRGSDGIGAYLSLESTERQESEDTKF